MNKYGIYIHIPFCKSRCKYCSFVSGTDFSLQQKYVQRLISEILDRCKDISADTVYIGGGTPSTLYEGAISSIISAVRGAANIVEGSEITIECNPDSVDDNFVEECVKSGVNRISMGLQTTDNKLLKLIGRPHSYNDFQAALQLFLQSGISNVSADLMLGLPAQNIISFEHTLNKIFHLPLKHISVYSLKVEEGTPLYKQGFVADEDLQADMYDVLNERIQIEGFERYEVSNFAKHGFKSRHNSKYWDLSPYLGLGAAAHSFDGKIRYENISDVEKYIEGDSIADKTELSLIDLKTEFIMLGLRTSEGISLKKYFKLFGEDLMICKEKQINKLLKNKLIEVGESIRLTDSAYYIMNSVILELI